MNVGLSLMGAFGLAYTIFMLISLNFNALSIVSSIFLGGGCLATLIAGLVMP